MGVDQNLFVGCPGDCDQNGQVNIDELLTLVNIAIGSAPQTSCPALLCAPTITDLLQAVDSAVSGCPLVAKYRLTAGSKIIYSPTTKNTSVIEEPLSGDFVLVFKRYELQFLDFLITAVDFHSPSFVITPATPGNAATFMVGLSNPPEAFITATLDINSAVAELSGTGPYDCGNTIPFCSTAPAVLENIVLCSDAASCEAISSGSAVGYVLSLFAALD